MIIWLINGMINSICSRSVTYVLRAAGLWSHRRYCGDLGVAGLGARAEGLLGGPQGGV